MDYAEAKQLPVELLSSLGLADVYLSGRRALKIPYFDIEGKEAAVRFRIARDGTDKFRWKKGCRPLLYGLNHVGEAHKTGTVTIVEGESDCHTLWNADFKAIGLPGAGNWNEQRDASLLDGINTIYVVIEPDKGGETVRRWLDKSRIRDRVKIVRLDGVKDPSALYLDDPGRFHQRWRDALTAAVPWRDVADREAEAEAMCAKEAAGDLIRETDLLGRFARDVERAGLVGETVNAKILFLALTSRVFDRPVSIAIKGVSSGGKSFTVQIVLKFFSAEAYWERTSMSDHTLAYSEEDFRHRFLVVYEAAGMTSDRMSYFMRTLLSESRICHETVEKTSDGMRPRVIEKEGPTGLITTTTAARLHPENETRLLSLGVKDTPEQTRAVMLALAADDAGDNGAVDFSRWQAFQRWLAAGECGVTVPFGQKLADLIPAVAVRLRRDFKLLLTMIRAHVLLHREMRARDDRGRIIALPADYGAVRELIAELVADGIEATVPKTLEETVAAVKALGNAEVSISDLAKALTLDKSSVSHRVRKAIDRGYLVNHETGRGRPARIALGGPIPTKIEIMPHPDALADCCSVGVLQGGGGHPPLPCPSRRGTPMDGVALLSRAKAAGLRVEAADGKLLIRGPKRAEPVVKLLVEHKVEVLAALANTTYEVNPVAPSPFERIIPPVEGEPGLELQCAARRGRVQELGGVFLHFCGECGAYGAFGYGVSLRAGRMGRWYCGEHRPGGDVR